MSAVPSTLLHTNTHTDAHPTLSVSRISKNLYCVLRDLLFSSSHSSLLPLSLQFPRTPHSTFSLLHEFSQSFLPVNLINLPLVSSSTPDLLLFLYIPVFILKSCLIFKCIVSCRRQETKADIHQVNNLFLF